MRVGLGVDGAAVRVVVLRAGTVIWTWESQRAGRITGPEPADDVEARITAALRAVPTAYRGRRWGRCPAVTVCVGGPFAQLKHLVGLPPVGDRTELVRLLTANVHRFFRRSGGPLVPAGVHADQPGQAWAAMVDAALIDAAARACARSGCRLALVAPTLASLGHAALTTAPGVPDICWDDDGARVALAFDADRLPTDLVRAPRFATADGGPTPPAPAGRASVAEVAPALSTLGEGAWRFAAAYAAAALGPRFPLAHRPRRGSLRDALTAAAPGRGGWRTLVRVGFAGAACAAGLAWAASAPALAARRTARAAARQLAAIGPGRIRALRATEDSARATRAALAALTAVRGRPESVAHVLAAVANALPLRAALVSFAYDSAGGSVVALAPRAAAVVTAVETLPGVADVTIVGAITRETVGPAAQATPGVPAGVTAAAVPAPPGAVSTVAWSAASAGPPAAMTGPPAERVEVERVALRFRVRRPPTADATPPRRHPHRTTPSAAGGAT